MGDSGIETLIPMIDAIISAANPDDVSPKSIREALQVLFRRDLNQIRKPLNALIVERFEEIQAYPRMLVRKDEMMKRDQEYNKLIEEAKKGKTKKATTSSTKRSLKTETDKKVKKAKKEKVKKTKKKSEKSKEPSHTGIATRMLHLSRPLSEIVHADQLPRTQVVKGVWEYIKEHNLQNPNDRREIICDEKMQKVFGKSTTMFKMNKQLVDHMYNADEILPPKEEPEPVVMKPESSAVTLPVATEQSQEGKLSTMATFEMTNLDT